MALVTGDEERAKALFDAVNVPEIADDGTLGFTMPLLCEVAAAVGDEERCRELIERLDRWRGIHLSCGPVYGGAVDRLSAMLHDRVGDAAAADALFSTAVDQHRAMRSDLWEARTRLDWSQSLLRRGDPASARPHLDAVQVTVASADFPEIEARLDVLRESAETLAD